MANTITPRKIYIEDLNLSTSPTAATTTETIMGSGTQTVTKVDMVRFTQFVQAANDTAAAAASVPVGGIYYNTSTSALHTRMT